jgi:conjugative relaxase-like TrwC/TraI family protein
MLRMIDCKGGRRVYRYHTACRRHPQYGRAPLQEEVGEWHGTLAERLGLAGPVRTQDFRLMCQNQLPATGQRLTCRTKSELDRRVVSDANFSCPKGFSLMCLMMGQTELLSLFRTAHLRTMAEMEKEVRVRVRKNGSQWETRETGNLAWVDFIHLTSRPIKRKTDPHVHVHDDCLNATYDDVEGVIKAAEMGIVRTHLPYYEAAFHARLAGAVEACGYRIQRQGRWWDIDGIPREVIMAFSNRSSLIQEEWAKGQIRTAAAKAQLAMITRERKTNDTLDDLIPEWWSRLGPPEVRALERVVIDAQSRRGMPRPSMVASDALDYAVQQIRPNRPTLTTHQFMTQALWHGLGHVRVDEVWAEMERRERTTPRPMRQPNEEWEAPAEPGKALDGLDSAVPLAFPNGLGVNEQPDGEWEVPVEPVVALGGPPATTTLGPSVALGVNEQSNEGWEVPAQPVTAEAGALEAEVSGATTDELTLPQSTLAPLRAPVAVPEKPGPEKISGASPSGEGEPDLEDDLPAI